MATVTMGDIPAEASAASGCSQQGPSAVVVGAAADGGGERSEAM